ncbi:MAG: AMP-binding protein [Cytophagales bacterium]|nr:AMP-binding protein [Cytophagales bacterium]
MIQEERKWLKSYERGIPHTIEVTKEYHSLTDLIEKSFHKYADLPAFKNMGVEMTYRELDVQSTCFAAFLQQQLKLKKGDRIALQMPNVLQYPVAIVGALRAGLVIINTNPLYTVREMVHQFNDAGIKAVVVLENFADKVEQALPELKEKPVVVTARMGDLLGTVKGSIVDFVVKYVRKMVPPFSIPHAVSFKDALKAGKKLSLEKVNIDSSDIALLQYTGGTTGVSKGAVLTHYNMLGNLMQNRAWMSKKLSEASDVIVTALPLYHIFAMTVNFFTFLTVGAKNVLITNPRDMKTFLSEIKGERFTVFTAVNTLFNAMMEHQLFKEVDFSRLRVCIGGGMAVQDHVATKWKQMTGCVLSEGYGLTECSPVVCCHPLNGNGKLGSIGLPFPSTDVSIQDDEGNHLTEHQKGELCVKGPQVMAGYWNDGEINDVTENGWLRTGDIAYIDEDGMIFIVDRKKEMINVSGFNVFPNEVEEVIAKHPAVLEVGVKGIENPKTTEAVQAFVVLRSGQSVTKEELRAYCKKELTAYKVPKFVEFRDELPKSNVGKILRRELK